MITSGVGSLIILLLFGLGWVTLTVWRYIRARSPSAVQPTVAVIAFWFAAYWFATTRILHATHPQNIAVLTYCLATAAEPIDCIRRARRLDGSVAMRAATHGRVGVDATATDIMAEAIAFASLKYGVAPAQVDCMTTMDRLMRMSS